MKTNNNYINEAIKNPKYIILLNGKEVKKFAFYRQAKHFAERNNGNLFEHVCIEIANKETGEILK